MSLDLQEAQRMALVRMLQLKSLSVSSDGRLEVAPQWKVLVYDRFAQDVIAPILKACRILH
jgi:hypothetical protein